MPSLTSRRAFLQGAPCAALGSTSIMSTLLNLKMANQAVAAGMSNAPGNDRKTIVCLFLHGGIDSYNLLVPRNNEHYADYQAARTNIALAQNDLLPLHETAPDGGRLYGLHPATSGFQELFNGLDGDSAKRRLSFIANIGTLIQPTTRQQYYDESVALPPALFSHKDQNEQWQTSLPQGADRLTGWAGRIADVLHCTHNQDLTSMSLSLSGNNIFQVGRETSQFVLNRTGALRFSQRDGNPRHATSLKNSAIKSLMEQEYTSLMKTAFSDLTRENIEQQAFMQEKFSSLPSDFVSVRFPNTGIGADLKNAVRMIKLRPELGLRRQTIFIGSGGWDHHGLLLEPMQNQLSQVAPAVKAFQAALEELGLADSVITFTASDFARTLRSNGRGSDHAWGGHHMVFGGPVNGGQILGNYPELTLSNDNPFFVSRGGRTIPTISVDSLIGELLLWFGLEGASNFDTVLPNLKNFYDLASADPSDPSTFPIGFLKPNTFS